MSTRSTPLRWPEILQRARHGNPVPARRVERSEADWQARLAPERWQVLRAKGTERPYSSAHCHLRMQGGFRCAGCQTLLFDGGLQFESGTGWPSFQAPVEPDHLSYHLDSSHGMQRVEVCCAICDGHLGHVFADGPPPTGLRYCLNGLALEPAQDAEQATATATALLAGGCFWGMQELLRALPGVLATRVGYCGDQLPRPRYHHHGDHAETVEVVFDPRKLDYRRLLEFFFRIHDPSTRDRQGNDRGRSYRSAIFVQDEEQRRIAEQTLAAIARSGRWPGPPVTEIISGQTFWEAEVEHQDYLQHHPDGYSCHWERPQWVLPDSRED